MKTEPTYTEQMTLIMIPQDQWQSMINTQNTILERLKAMHTKQPAFQIKYISAIKFMNAVGIKRTKFDELVHANKLKTIKKKRKIYLPVTEIDRYFTDPNIQ